MASIKEELISAAESESQVMQIVQAALEGIDMDALTSMTPGLPQTVRQTAINSLLSSKKLAIQQAPGGVLRLKVNTSEQIAGTEEEQVVSISCIRKKEKLTFFITDLQSYRRIEDAWNMDKRTSRRFRTQPASTSKNIEKSGNEKVDQDYQSCWNYEEVLYFV